MEEKALQQISMILDFENKKYKDKIHSKTHLVIFCLAGWVGKKECVRYLEPQ